MSARNLVSILRLVLVTDPESRWGTGPGLLDAIAGAVRGGVSLVQVRQKSGGAREVAALVRALQSLIAVPVFVNDLVDVAIATGASGVHLGPDDLAPRLARRVVPPEMIIGASVGSPADIPHADGADYWGIGPLHRSSTKNDAGVALGLPGVSELVERADRLPTVIIGGVRPTDLPWIEGTLGSGVAVSSGILQATDPEAAARTYQRSLGSVAS